MDERVPSLRFEMLSAGMSASFDSVLLPKCRDRLNKARAGLFYLRNAHTLEEFRSLWASFLVDTGGFIHAVEAGSKATPQGLQWYGGIRRTMRGDPLIRFMYQARNAEEHGREPLSYVPNGMPFGFMDSETGEVEWISDEYRPITASRRRIVIGFPPDGPLLRPVRDERFKEVFPLPREHLGRCLVSNDPLTVAELYLVYLEGLLVRVEELC